MSKVNRSKPWPVKDVRYVEVAPTGLTTRHLHIEFDHGIRIVVVNENQLIGHLRREANTTSVWCAALNLIESISHASEKSHQTAHTSPKNTKTIVIDLKTLRAQWK
ncbi:hypothetical protein [Roseibacillus persicicus]|uniref:hypothetical protein n=1 Tax=Roseibacillus persicicus TaxID=454148 RepID=UPI0016783C74|nr:hypothetical protein [Roseibacillus persicicus]